MEVGRRFLRLSIDSLMKRLEWPRTEPRNAADEVFERENDARDGEENGGHDQGYYGGKVDNDAFPQRMRKGSS